MKFSTGRRWKWCARQSPCRGCLTPWPGAYTYHGEERWQLWRAQAAQGGGAEAEPGAIIEVTKEAIRIATEKGSLLLQEIQPASGKRLSVRQYLVGHQVAIGSILTPSPVQSM